MPHSGRHNGAAAIVVAAGTSTRFGRDDKVLAEIAGRPVLAYVFDEIERAATIHSIVVVAGEHTMGEIQILGASGEWSKLRGVVIGGPRRQDSVAIGLEATRHAEIVVVHDGARPFASASLFDACVDAARATGAAIAAIPVTDTLKQVEGGRITGTVPRQGLWAAQTPQAARWTTLREAFDRARQSGITVTDEASLLEELGVPIQIVEGVRTNIKVTHPDDIALAEALLAAGQLR